MTEAEKKVARAKRAGIQRADLVWRLCLDEKLPFFVACAFLMQESGGGRNVWGHDPTWMIGYPVLNEDTYGVYKAHRDHFGQQGVGPMQLTYWSIQDEADDLGGCWIPEHNMRVGFRLLVKFFGEAPGSPPMDRWWWAARRYNGAESYADRMVLRIDEWRGIVQGDE